MAEDNIPEAHFALKLGKEQRITTGEMLQRLVIGKVAVPLTEPPKIKDDMIEHWHPAILTKSDGTNWIPAFTTAELCAAFCGGRSLRAISRRPPAYRV